MHTNLAKPRMCACALLYQAIRAGDSVIGTKFIYFDNLMDTPKCKLLPIWITPCQQQLKP
jgi:hypothetical protein